MLFVTTQPDSDYYIWQLQVQLNNFKKFGCEDKCVVVFGYNPTLGINPNALEFEKHTFAKVLYYPDTRDLSVRLYLPSIRPHLLKQLYKNNPEVLDNRNFFYLDCDILLTDYPDFNILDDEKFVHLSPTPSEFSIEYVKKKNYELFEKMCRAVGISTVVVDKNRHTGGGVTYFVKNFNYLDFSFWDKVEKDSVALYKMMLVTVNKDSYIQILTANKWALLWNLWLIGYDTKPSEELSMTWPNSPIEEWNKNNLYNNAGVTEDERKFLFYKGDFFYKSPFGEDLSYVSNKYCSSKYVEEIISTEKGLNSWN
jgi:hypothetical protein